MIPDDVLNDAYGAVKESSATASADARAAVDGVAMADLDWPFEAKH